MGLLWLGIIACGSPVERATGGDALSADTITVTGTVKVPTTTSASLSKGLAKAVTEATEGGVELCFYSTAGVQLACGTTDANGAISVAIDQKTALGEFPGASPVLQGTLAGTTVSRKALISSTLSSSTVSAGTLDATTTYAAELLTDGEAKITAFPSAEKILATKALFGQETSSGNGAIFSLTKRMLDGFYAAGGKPTDCGVAGPGKLFQAVNSGNTSVLDCLSTIASDLVGVDASTMKSTVRNFATVGPQMLTGLESLMTTMTQADWKGDFLSDETFRNGMMGPMLAADFMNDATSAETFNAEKGWQAFGGFYYDKKQNSPETLSTFLDEEKWAAMESYVTQQKDVFASKTWSASEFDVMETFMHSAESNAGSLSAIKDYMKNSATLLLNSTNGVNDFYSNGTLDTSLFMAWEAQALSGSAITNSVITTFIDQKDLLAQAYDRSCSDSSLTPLQRYQCLQTVEVDGDQDSGGGDSGGGSGVNPFVSGGTLTVDQASAGTLATAGTTITFAFAPSSTGSYTVLASAVTLGGAATGLLYNSISVSSNSSCQSGFVYTLTAGRSYQVIVTAAPNTSPTTGTFRVIAQSGDQCVQPPAEENVITIGGAPAEGTIATVGATVTLSLTPASTGLLTIAYIAGQPGMVAGVTIQVLNGGSEVTSSGSCAGRIVYSLTGGTTYSVRVRASDYVSPSTGTFAVAAATGDLCSGGR